MVRSGHGEMSTLLHKAARHKTEEEIDRLLCDGADVAAKDGEGRTPLHLAVMRGHTGIIRRLLRHGSTGVLLSRDILGCTPVHLAAVQYQVRLIMLLLNSLLEDLEGGSILHEIARLRCVQDFVSFLHLGWDVACPQAMNSGSQDAGAAPGSNFERISQFLGRGELHQAAMEGKVSSIEKLVESCSFYVHVTSVNSWTPLHYAAAYNQVEAIDVLVRLGAKINCQNSAGTTPLHLACGEGHVPAVQKLTDLGCNLLVKDQDGCIPLDWAVAWNCIEVVRYLYSLGSPLCGQSEEGRSALHIAAEQGWVEMIEVLVKELGSKVNCRDAYEFTPLHSAANWGWVEAIRKLVELSHDVDVKDQLDRTPLHYAALHGRAEAIQELFKMGGDLHQCDSQGGNTPLHLAADAGQCEAVAKLIELGADMEAQTSKGLTCIQLTTMKGPANIDVLELLVDLGANITLAADSVNLEMPLHIAARAGQLDVVKKLISRGAPVTEKTKDGSTPLHYAAAFGQAHVLGELVKAGNNVEPLDNARNTPLHLAAGCGFLDAVLVLVQLGGNLDCRDMSDCTPLQNAAHGTYSAFAEVSSGINQFPKENLQGLESLSLRRSGLSSALLPGEFAGDADGGMVPVRTGFAWATIGRPNRSWKGSELMNLLRKVMRSRNFGGLLNGSSLVENGNFGEPSKCEDSADARGYHGFLEDREGLELLLKKTESFHIEHMEQDRSRLLPVAEAIVQMGADISAVDNEGRTALHLAAGCGDRAMVIKLAELGLDVNCKDGVGGTPMHHAAMANKKEVMFTLARLGTDWRVKAEGIDMATASFVLCGQHGKSARQQKLLDARLKRVFSEGEIARRRGKSPATAIDVDEEDKQEEELDELVERANANMAALLEEEAKATTSERKPKKKNRRRGKQADGTVEESVCRSSSISNCYKAEKGDVLESSKSMSASPEPRTNSFSTNTMHHNKCPPGRCENGPSQAVRLFLDESVMCANTVLEIGAATGGEAMQDVLDRLDAALQQANQAGLGTKHARKVRSRLQALLNESTTRRHSQEAQESNALNGGLERCNETCKIADGRETSQSYVCVNSASPASERRESEWKQVGSHGKKNIGGVLVSRTCPGSRAVHSACAHHNRKSCQPARVETRPTKSSTIAVANGSVVVRTGNVVVVKTIATSNNTKPTSENHVHHQTSTAPDSASKPTKPAWKHGSKQKTTSNLFAASDPDFPPLPASGSGSSGNQEPSAPAGDPQVLEPSVSESDKEKSSSTGTQSDPKPYELFGGGRPRPAPLALSCASPFSQSPHGFAWGPIPAPNSHMCSLEEQQTMECANSEGCNHPWDQSGRYFESHAERSDTRGIPIPAPTNPHHTEHGPYYGGTPVDEMGDQVPGPACMWHAPMAFAPPVGYMPLMSSSLGIQTMNGVVGPYGLLPHVPNMLNQSTSFDSMLHSHRFQPPPPPGPPPQMHAGFSVYEQAHPVASCEAHVDASTDFHDNLTSEDPTQRDENLNDMGFLTMGDSPEAPLSVSRHLLGELEAEIGM